MGGSDVYGPREDTDLLGEAALEEVGAEDVVLEVGSGSGAVAAAVAPEARRVVATDIERAAAEATADRGVPVVRTDLVAGVAGPFSLVLCNPPYLPDDDRTPHDGIDAAVAGGPTGRELVSRFLATVGRVLADDGRILLLVTSATDIGAVRERAEREGYSWSVVAEDRFFFERFVVARLRPR